MYTIYTYLKWWNKWEKNEYLVFFRGFFVDLYQSKKVENLKLASNQPDLMDEQQRLTHDQQRQIQVLKQELFNVKNLLMETNCTEVKKCVAEDLMQIDNSLIAHDNKILLNKALINQVIIFFNRLIKITQNQVDGYL